MPSLVRLKNQVTDALDNGGDWVALSPIRLLMAYEFGPGKLSLDHMFVQKFR